MATTPDKRVPVAIGSMRASAFIRETEETMEKAEVEFSPLDNAVQGYLPGELKTALTFTGGLDGDYTNAVASAYQQSGYALPTAIGQSAGGSVGGPVTIGALQVMKVGVGSSRGTPGSITMGSVGLQRSLGYWGYQNYFSGAIAASTVNGAGVNAGAVGASQILIGQLNVVSLTGTLPTVDVIIQSAATDSWGAPTSRITFAQLTAAGSQITSAAGPITDGWFRVNVVVGGTGVAAVLCVAFSIEENTFQIT